MSNKQPMNPALDRLLEDGGDFVVHSQSCPSIVYENCDRHCSGDETVIQARAELATLRNALEKILERYDQFFDCFDPELYERARTLLSTLPPKPAK